MFWTMDGRVRDWPQMVIASVAFVVRFFKRECADREGPREEEKVVVVERATAASRRLLPPKMLLRTLAGGGGGGGDAVVSLATGGGSTVRTMSTCGTANSGSKCTCTPPLVSIVMSRHSVPLLGTRPSPRHLPLSG